MIQLVANTWSDDENGPDSQDVSQVYYDLADRFIACQAELSATNRDDFRARNDLSIALEPLAFRPHGTDRAPSPDNRNPEEARLRFPMGRGTMAVLNYLSDHDGQASPTAIAEGVAVSTSRISGILSTLERRGWVTRRHDETDRRKVIVTLTEEGARNVEGTAQTIRNALAAILADLGERDGGELLELLQQVAAFTGAHPDYVLDMRIRKVGEA